jgi:hypothetical protein
VVALCLLSAVRAQAASHARVLLVAGKGVSADAQAALGSAIAADAQLLDAREYNKLARSEGLLPTSERALERVAPELQPDLIVVVQKSGSKLALIYRDGSTGEVLRKETVAKPPRRGPKAARAREQLASSVRNALASLAPKRAADAPAVVAKQPQAPMREPEPEPEPEPEAFAEAEPEAPARERASMSSEPMSSEPTQDDESALAPDADESGQGETLAANGLRVELSAGLGGAMRQSALPTRLGVHELSTGLHPGVSLGLAATGALGAHFVLRATVDYRSSLGLHGVETQGVA